MNLGGGKSMNKYSTLRYKALKLVPPTSVVFLQLAAGILLLKYAIVCKTTLRMCNLFFANNFN